MKNFNKILTLGFILCVGSFTQASEQVIESATNNNPDIIYVSDTGHTNQDLLSVYIDLVQKLVTFDREFNCVLVEADRELFQPAIEKFMYEGASWDRTVGVAQQEWEQVTGRPYKQIPLEFLTKMKDLGVKVEAVDWADRSPVSETMKSLFKLGFAGDMQSLKLAFDLGIDARNSVMAYNIKTLMDTSLSTPAKCSKAIMFVGGLHLASKALMPMGEINYTSIAANPLLKNLQSSTLEILDCRSISNLRSDEDAIQCNDKNLKDKYEVKSLFSTSNEVLRVKSSKSSSKEGSFIKEMMPPLSTNIMIY